MAAPVDGHFLRTEAEGPVPVLDDQRRADLVRLLGDGVHGLVGLAGDDAGDARFENPSLFGGDFGERIAQVLLMVHGHRHDDRERRLADGVGGVEAAAEPGFQQHDVGGGAGKGQEGGDGGDLEKGDRAALVGLFADFQDIAQAFIVDDLAGHPDAFVEAHQMGRGVNMDLFTGGFQGASHQRDYRAFAVGARNVDDGCHVHVRRAQFAQQF